MSGYPQRNLLGILAQSNKDGRNSGFCKRVHDTISAADVGRIFWRKVVPIAPASAMAALIPMRAEKSITGLQKEYLSQSGAYERPLSLRSYAV
jgi:hypothetical protein